MSHSRETLAVLPAVLLEQREQLRAAHPAERHRRNGFRSKSASQNNCTPTLALPLGKGEGILLGRKDFVCRRVASARRWAAWQHVDLLSEHRRAQPVASRGHGPPGPPLVRSRRALMSDTDFCMIARMKTTLDLRDDLLVRAKETAAREGTSLTRMIEESLALRLRRRRAVAGKLKPLPVSARNGGLRAGIDGRSNRSLFDAADA